MDRDRWRRINDIFQGAIERGADERRPFLATVCAGDAELRKRVERLVQAHEYAAGFLARPPVTNAHSVLSLNGFSAPSACSQPSCEGQVRFRGTDRYRIRRCLGAGGMGIVYAVHDCIRDEEVALKTLRRARPADASRLKREFRSLSDIAHPNLACLHELVVAPDHCFFTMELVDGQSMSDYVRSAGQHAGFAGAANQHADPRLVRDVLHQLVSGLSALHGKGKLHRDIKPSNIMVGRDGRLVILDFGLVSDVLPGSATAGERMAGTPVYLAPEQHGGADPSEASDWYAVGVTLYEALTGRLPFGSSWRELHSRKRHSDPPPPVWIDPEIPDDLNDVCVGLLCRDPAQRLSGPEAPSRLAAGSRARQRGARPGETRRGKPCFVGRTRELAMLDASLSTVRGGRALAVCVNGPSGIGKTALVQQFLDQLPDETVVLRGRCYQHESVPYEALDGIVESLSAYLRGLPPAHTWALLPSEAGVLVRVFPTLLQVAAIADSERGDSDDPSPSAQRHLAFQALREILTRIAQRRALVLYVDDLHWADADSIRLLEALVRPPEPPPLLLLACLRTEEIASKPFLQAFLAGADVPLRASLLLEPLMEDETRDVMAAMVPHWAKITEAERLALTREAAGNPFLLEQLAQHATRQDASDTRSATLGDMLRHRLETAPAGARRFLEMLAVSGKPMPPHVIYRAAGLTGDERQLVAILRSDHLLRHSGSASRIEMYHDRMRETLVGQLTVDETCDAHRRLAQALAASGCDDSEALFEHCRGAGDHDAAARHAALAAIKARAVLAFDRAAFFYRSALELRPRAHAAIEWKRGLADALADGGRPPEAAKVYLEAAADMVGWRQVDLQRRAAEQFLIGGHVDRGMNVIRTVLRVLNLRLAAHPLLAFASLLWRRARVRTRGLAFVARDPDHIPAETLLRIDTCWSVTTGLAMVDSVRAAEINSRHLLLALDAGEPYRIARAMALEAAFLASTGNRRRSDECAAHAAHAARQSERPHAEALAALTTGMAAFLAGEWKTTSRMCERALVVLREQCTAVTWETNCAESFLLYSLLFQGEIGDVSRRLPALLAAARDRGNRYLETELRTRLNVVWLAADRPDEGERHTNEAMKHWSHNGFHRQHYSHVLARTQTALYRGDAATAWHLIAGNWTAFERTLLLRVRYLHIETLYLRARAALLNAAQGRDARRFLSIVRKDIRRIRRYGMRWSDAIAMLLDATVIYLEGRPGAARDVLTAAAASFDNAGMTFHAAVTRRRLGFVQGGDGGRALIDAADAWMAGQDIRNPAGMARLIAPGFADPDRSSRSPRDSAFPLDKPLSAM